MVTNTPDISMDPLESLSAAAAQLLQLSGGRRVWLLEGGLGAGKTTLIQHVCRQLGVKSAVQSPTFSLVNEYLAEQGLPVYHFDLYRLKNVREAYEIGLEEYLDSGHYCFIEWPEVAQALWPEDAFRLVLTRNDSGERVVTLPTHHPVGPSIQ